MFKVNEYFDGKVKSISFTETEGAATVGVLAQGEYEFNTGKAEIMSIVSGKVAVSLPGESGWREVNAGEKFHVPANSKFGIKALVESAYLCQFR
ncbi:pyrimidine/purine nucleoside phosphorylase [Sulfurivermis fontis]|uniref:pyrimidine/purine nucleoside phosphorylase n=1 Tax=Sulfurivermis fontis TaxID=1972068 RepID=UPI000FDC6567|nr:pyrimidine/purine nucleoside phosphorylase [Sulfurivermis fontis]